MVGEITVLRKCQHFGAISVKGIAPGAGAQAYIRRRVAAHDDAVQQCKKIVLRTRHAIWEQAVQASVPLPG